MQTTNSKSLEALFDNYYKTLNAVEMLNYFGVADPELIDPLRAFLAKKLETTIPDDLKTQIENVTGNRVLLVGENIELINNLASYFYCIKGEHTFCFYDLHDKDKTEQAASINNSEEHFYSADNKLKKGGLKERLEQNCSVFLRRLDCKDSEGGLFLIKLAYKINAIQQGMLIVSTATPLDDIPQEFKSLFKIVELEPEKQIPAQDTPQKQDREQIPKEIFYDKSNGILFLNENRWVEFCGVDKEFIECFLKEKDRLHVDSVIDRMSERRINTSWDRGYFDSTLSEINKKGRPLEVGKLIRNTGERSGEYLFFTKVKFKKFQK